MIRLYSKQTLKNRQSSEFGPISTSYQYQWLMISNGIWVYVNWVSENDGWKSMQLSFCFSIKLVCRIFYSFRKKLIFSPWSLTFLIKANTENSSSKIMFLLKRQMGPSYSNVYWSVASSITLYRRSPVSTSFQIKPGFQLSWREKWSWTI